MENIGKNLRAFRMKAVLDQGEAAKLIGIKVARLNNWEKNVAMPSVPMLFKMAEVYGVTTDQLGKGVPAQ